ncbi:DUF4279 domain-containing protein [Pseudoalteromonas sp. SR45-1]|uniref:DUF4279 domain-containing protein n=1 Tax=Pseudoalteromonas sp. SR45-1 TaxID=2760932 RepID=UPI001601F090|nr:DUF4279 domain-containing protein [Pseudoalteromonas sp. SR45-1]MBB1327389.1 DUF4279 domain-containing protein [Pseudoalteromonas sp. SR45-1]|tara:strand:+ start:820 stop:1194 length:375 start_codon:yes stop_codon:yes gene_type:complete
MLECKASLRVKSDSLSLEEIVYNLGEPTKGFSKGQEFGKVKKKRPHTQWMLTTDEESSMQEAIDQLLCFYLERSINSDLKAKASIDIFCMISSDNGQGSFTIDSSLYEKLLKAGLKITFDFYSD